MEVKMGRSSELFVIAALMLLVFSTLTCFFATKAMLIEPGGSTYPVPRHVMEMPKADGLLERTIY
jgi:hypothetical protein